MRILFCGDTFPSARLLLRQRLTTDVIDELCVWTDRRSPIDLRNIDVLIPMMFMIDSEGMDAGEFKLIQQWGSGLEGVAWNLPEHGNSGGERPCHRSKC